MLFLIALGCGIVVGRAAGGDLAGLTSVRVSWVGVPIGVGVAQLLIGRVPVGWHLWVVMVSLLIVGGWLVAQVVAGTQKSAFGLMAIGWAANAAVMALNSGMPVSGAALRSVGSSGEDVAVGHLYRHVPLTASTQLPWLADRLVVPHVGAIVSVGDFGILGGVALLAAGAVRGGRQFRCVDEWSSAPAEGSEEVSGPVSVSS